MGVIDARRRAGWAAILLSFGLVASACGGGDAGGTNERGDGDDGTTTEPLAADELDLDATIRIAQGAPVTSLDPHLHIHKGELIDSMLIYDRLTQLDLDLEVQPMLATGWEVVDDGAALELTLRDDVVFQDGTAFDAEAVKVNLDRGKEIEGSRVADLLTSIDSVEVVDEHTVRLILVPGTGADLPAVLATNAGMMISPAAIEDGRDLASEPGDAGSGPYRVVEHDPGVKTVFERADFAYWDAENAGRAARIEMGFLADDQARLSGLQSGQLDVVQVTGLAQPNAQDLGAAGDFQEFTRPTGILHMVLMQAETVPIEVRQAVSLGVDRQALGDELFAGNCVPSRQLFAEGQLGHDEEIDADLARDVDGAVELLEGIDSSDLTLEVTYAAGSSQETMVQGFSDQLDEVGIDIVDDPVPSPSDTATQFTSGESIAAEAVLVPDADPALLVANYLLGGFDLVPEGSPDRAAIEELATEALDPTLSDDERAAAYQEISRIFSDGAYSVPLCHSRHTWLASNDAVGIDNAWFRLGLADARTFAIRA